MRLVHLSLVFIPAMVLGLGCASKKAAYYKAGKEPHFVAVAAIEDWQTVSAHYHGKYSVAADTAEALKLQARKQMSDSREKLLTLSKKKARLLHDIQARRLAEAVNETASLQ